MTGCQGWSRSCLTSDWMSRTVREMWLPRQDKIGNNFLVNCLIKAIAYATGTNYLYYCSAINPPWQANLYLYFFKYCRRIIQSPQFLSSSDFFYKFTPLVVLKGYSYFQYLKIKMYCTSTLLEKCCRISLHLTDKAFTKLSMT